MHPILFDALTDPYHAIDHLEDPLTGNEPTPLRVTVNRKCRGAARKRG